MASWFPNQKVSLVLSVFWTVIIIVLSTLPGKDLPQVNIINADKIAHLGVYAIHGVFLMLALRGRFRRSSLVFILSFSLGAGLEFIQEYFLVDRHFDYADMTANGIGSLLGIVIMKRLN